MSNNDKFLEFQRKYGKKICAWVDENIIMPCFEPTENTESLNKLDETIKIGETIKLPIKTIDNAYVNKVKKLISENNIKYIYSNKRIK